MNIVPGWRFVAACWAASLRSAMEYRSSFLLQSVFMLANNLFYLAFWALFFARFQGLAGWTLRDQALLYGIVATGFGLASVFAGGTLDLAARIASGGLDTWLLRSRPALVQAAIARMRLSGFGDIATGPILLVATGNVSATRVAAFVFASLLVSIGFASFWTLCNCTAFWMGHAEDVAMQGTNAALTFALHPERLFGPATRALLYVIVPAGILGWLPADLVRSWTWREAGLLVAGTSGLVLAALLAWTSGLRRYEGGNLTQGAMD